MDKNDTYKADHRARKKKSLLDKAKSYTTGSISDNHIAYQRETYGSTVPGEYVGIVSSIDSIQNEKIFSVFNSEAGLIEKMCLDISLPKQLAKDLLIGDYITYRKSGEQNFLMQRLPRVNTLSRLKSERDGSSGARSKKLGIVANIDIGIIVAAAINPAFHANFIDRYAILLQYSNIRPLICITKSDLYTLQDPILDWYQQKLGIDVIYCSVETGQGLDFLKEKIIGKTTVVLGNSGVGKSSLINALIGENKSRTGEVSTKSGQGKHTTTTSQFYQWAAKSYIIDTPGIRSLELLEIQKDQLKDYFPDFLALSDGCKYKDCTHTHEPSCGIKASLSTDQVSQARYDNYIRIREKLC